MVAQPANWDVMITKVMKGMTTLFIFINRLAISKNLLFIVQSYHSFRGDARCFSLKIFYLLYPYIIFLLEIEYLFFWMMLVFGHGKLPEFPPAFFLDKFCLLDVLRYQSLCIQCQGTVTELAIGGDTYAWIVCDALLECFYLFGLGQVLVLLLPPEKYEAQV